MAAEKGTTARPCRFGGHWFECGLAGVQEGQWPGTTHTCRWRFSGRLAGLPLVSCRLSKLGIEWIHFTATTIGLCPVPSRPSISIPCRCDPKLLYVLAVFECHGQPPGSSSISRCDRHAVASNPPFAVQPVAEVGNGEAAAFDYISDLALVQPPFACAAYLELVVGLGWHTRLDPAKH